MNVMRKTTVYMVIDELEHGTGSSFPLETLVEELSKIDQS